MRALYAVKVGRRTYVFSGSKLVDLKIAVDKAYASYKVDQNHRGPWAWRRVTAICWVYGDFVVQKPDKRVTHWHALYRGGPLKRWYGRFLAPAKFLSAEGAMRWVEKKDRDRHAKR